MYEVVQDDANCLYPKSFHPFLAKLWQLCCPFGVDSLDGTDFESAAESAYFRGAQSQRRGQARGGRAGHARAPDGAESISRKPPSVEG